MKILLVEDEIQLSKIISKGLKKLSYAVDVAFDGEEAINMFNINYYDLIILDLNIPKIDGFSVLKKIRDNNLKIKIIILSAKNNVEDKIKGLDIGANDYLEKPFDFLELSARIRNLLRWNFISESNILEFKNLKLNMSQKCVYINNDNINLTNKEYAIIEYLFLNKDRFVSSEEIIEHIWESDKSFFSNSLKYHIYSLKKKLNIENIIINERGKGYKINV